MPKNKGGRPPAPVPTATVSARVPITLYDGLIQHAAATGQTVSAVVASRLSAFAPASPPTPGFLAQAVSVNKNL